MIDLKMDRQFKFGDKVWHAKHGTGVVIGTDQIVRVFFEEGIVIGFYATKVANEDRLISELVPASGWIDIDWDDESTLPSESMGVLVILGGDVNQVFYDNNFGIHDGITHWQPLPQPPK